MAKVSPGGKVEATAPVDAPDEEMAQAAISQWEFLETPPTREDVIELLSTLPLVFDVAAIDFADYVQALPQKKKVQRPHPSNPNLMVDDRIECWVLYMSVAGRIKMIQVAAEKNGWRVDFTPEPTTPTGAPGLIQMGDGRIVYREYCSIVDSDGGPVGSKPGMAWVPYSGGSNAAGSNPYEKVETAARGRAIGAWGFGVFPGSGVATLEEMQNVAGNKRAMDAEQIGQQRQSRGRQPRVDREELMQRMLIVMEEFRQHRGVSEETMRQEMAHYLGSIGVRDPQTDDQINWSNVHDGQLQLAVNKIQQHLRELVAQEWGGTQ